MKILIDPGHGGKELGAIGPGGLTEKEVNLRVAFFLKSLLEKDGFEVILTRTKDLTLSLKERVEIAKKHKPCLFLSIHHNANSERYSHINRFEVYVPFNYEGPSISLGKKLAEIFSQERDQITWGPIPARYTVLNSSPFSVLVEPGYIINPEEEKRLRSTSYLEEEASLLYKGIKWVTEKGCYFKFRFKRQTPHEIIISRENIDIGALEVTIDNIPWEHYSVDNQYIRILYPTSWKILRIHGKTSNGIELFPFSYKNLNYRPISSFSQSVSEFGNLKLIHLSFFDEKGLYTEKGINIDVNTTEAEILKCSKCIGEKGSVYILIKTNRPQTNVEVSLRGFQAITEVRSLEHLRNNEIAGIVESNGTPMENVLIKHEKGHTISRKFGVFKTDIDKKITFLKKGLYPYYLLDPEPQQNHFINMEPIFPGLFNKKILLRATVKNNVKDEEVQLFSLILKDTLLSAGAMVKDVYTEFPGWDNEPLITKEIIEERPHLSIKIQSQENKFVLYYYYRDSDTLEILKRISSYFYKFDLPSLEIRESSDYFVIHPSNRRIIVNIPPKMRINELYLYNYLLLLGIEHYYRNEPIHLEKLEARGNIIKSEYNLLSIPVKDGIAYLPKNILKLKFFTEEQKCIHSPDGN